MGGRQNVTFPGFWKKLEKLLKRSKCQAEIRVGRHEKLGVHGFSRKLAKVLFSGEISRKQLFP